MNLIDEQLIRNNQILAAKADWQKVADALKAKVPARFVPLLQKLSVFKADDKSDCDPFPNWLDALIEHSDKAPRFCIRYTLSEAECIDLGFESPLIMAQAVKDEFEPAWNDEITVFAIGKHNLMIQFSVNPPE